MFTNTPMDVSLWLKTHKANKAGRCPVSIRITINQVRAEVTTGVRLLPSEWNAATRSIIFTEENGEALRNYHSVLKTKESKVWLTKERIDHPGLTAAEVAQALRPAPAQPCLIDTAGRVLVSHYAHRNASTYQNFHRAVELLRSWQGRAPLPVTSFPLKRRREFAAWLCQQMSSSSARTYLDSLKSMWNRAGAWAAEEAINPFAGVRLPRHQTRKRLSLSPEQVRQLAELELSPTLSEARDLYLACVYLHGSRIGVVLSLRWSQIRKGVVKLQTAKGGPLKEITVRPALQAIFDRQPPRAELVFGLLPDGYDTLGNFEALAAMRRARTILWSRLRFIAARLGVEHLHVHTARHTMALLTYEKTKDFRAAQHMLGHSNPRTTEVYIRQMLNHETDEVAGSVYDDL